MTSGATSMAGRSWRTAPARSNTPGAGVAAIPDWPRSASPPRSSQSCWSSAWPHRPSSSGPSATGSPPTWSTSAAPRPRPGRSATARWPPNARRTSRAPRRGPSSSSSRTRSWPQPDPRIRKVAWVATSRCGRRSTPPSRASGRRSRTSPRWRRRSGPRWVRPTTTSAIRIGPSRRSSGHTS